MIYNIADLDVDCKDRDNILTYLKHIPASKITDKGLLPHGVGVYFCNIPKDLITGLSAIDYKEAEERYGFVKVDLLHNTTYDKFKTRTEMIDTYNKPIKWELLNDEEFVKTLPHIGSYFDFMKTMPKIDSIEKLAMFISIIRPGKKYLIKTVEETGNWDSIKNKIWLKEADGGYSYKKSHAISYASMISLYLH